MPPTLDGGLSGPREDCPERLPVPETISRLLNDWMEMGCL